LTLPIGFSAWSEIFLPGRLPTSSIGAVMSLSPLLPSG
jgi:hypothetical protein